jgi:predicted HicB family RNase H-like nuclease
LSDAFTDEVAVREQERRSDKPKKSQSITFRLDSNTFDELQREADQNQISLNVLVNQALKRYSDWDRYENRIGMMPVPKAILTS